MQLRFKAMGTNFHVIVPRADEVVYKQVENRIRELEDKWTRFDPASELMKLNSSAGETNFVSNDTIELLRAMIFGYQISFGAFNPTQLSAMNELGYDHSLNNKQKAAAIFDGRHTQRNAMNIEIQNNFVRIPTDMALDAGGIGKGLAADMIAAELSQAGYTDVMINAGGDLFASGNSPDGDPWIVRIENPLNSDETISRISFKSGGLATSSQLKRRFNNVGHLLNPLAEGKARDIVSVSVIAGKAAVAEVLTKVPFVHSNWQEIIQANQAAALVVLPDGSTLTTDNWSKYDVDN